MTVYKIRSEVLRKQGKRIEGADHDRMADRLAVVRKHIDPKARIIAIPETR